MCRNCGIWGASDSSSDPFELNVDEVEVPEERHEFHMLDPWHAYCICGWTGNDRLLAFDDSTAPAAFIGMLYRKHLE